VAEDLILKERPAARKKANTSRDVFINCPFDEQFRPTFRAIIFAVVRSGFRARSAQETDDTSENRFTKILQIIDECRYGIHDISRTEADGDPPLPRFNMPLELGAFLGAKRFGIDEHKRKRALVLDRDPHRYQRLVSDIAGQDIRCHYGEPAQAIQQVATWLRMQSHSTTVPGGVAIAAEFEQFLKDHLPSVLNTLQLQDGEMTFTDYANIVAQYAAEL
jgi:hypothetical protein